MAHTASLKKKLHFLMCSAIVVLAAAVPAVAQESTAGAVHSFVSENSSGQLRALQDSEGTFLLNYANGRIASQVAASDENMILRVMDSFSRVQHEVFWNKEYTAIEKEVYYQYQENRVIATTETRWFPSSKKRQVLTYAQSGLLIRQEEYSGAEDAFDTEKSTLDTTKTWKWDSEGRLIEECVTAEGKKRTDRTEYVYQAGKSQADEKTYENDDLVREIIWDDDVRYTEYVYFGNAQVISKYDDGILVSETMVMNGKEVRSNVGRSTR